MSPRNNVKAKARARRRLERWRKRPENFAAGFFSQYGEVMSELAQC